MWKAWKDTFNPLHKNIERETHLTRGEDSFRAAAASQLVHGINSNTVPAPFHGKIPSFPEGENLAKDFNAHFDNLVTATTHSNEIFQGNLGQIT